MTHISIHAPRTGSDYGDYCHDYYLSISIHAPRTGSDGDVRRGLLPCGGFQSTLPARGATCGAVKFAEWGGFQSTLPARGATGQPLVQAYRDAPISIHAPRTGSDEAVQSGTAQ